MRNLCGKVWDKRKALALAYSFLVFLVLPLYMKNGFVMIGDAKHELYFKGTVLMIGLSFIMLLFGMVSGKADLKKERSYAEIMALFYALVTLVSILFSMDTHVAVWGYADWHAGGIMQLMTIFGFFVMKNWLEDDRWSLIFLGVSSVAVCALTVVNRRGADPLNVYGGMDWFEWNRRNLIATIGNINWTCCFMAIGVPLLIWAAWTMESRFRIWGYACAWIAIAGILLQGSEAGILDLILIMAVLLWISAERWDRLLRTLELLTLIPLFWSVYSILKIDLITPADADIMGKYYSPLWLIPLALCMILRYGAGRLAKKDGEVCRFKKPIRLGMMLALLTGAGIFVACQFSDAVWALFGNRDILRFGDSWGSLRGGVWKETIRCFGKMGISQKLFGAGPDCYAILLESMKVRLAAEGQWEGAIYANAHNEFLTMLINEGILGAVTYYGIYACVAVKLAADKRRQPKTVLGIMILASYLGNQFFSFQQVISTPAMLMILGIVDGRKNITKERAEGHAVKKIKAGKRGKK